LLFTQTILKQNGQVKKSGLSRSVDTLVDSRQVGIAHILKFALCADECFSESARGIFLVIAYT